MPGLQNIISNFLSGLRPPRKKILPRHPISKFFARLRPRRLRTYREFAEQEIYLPDGPREGLPFRCDFMPFSALIFDVMSHGRYRRLFASGASQSGKTLIIFVIPILYHLFEVGETVIIGVPVVELARGIFEERLRPVIERTRYAEYLPTFGAGSRRGQFMAIRFRNGAMLRFMGAGGGDVQRSHYTSRIVSLTEVDKMDLAGKVSREADPVTQVETRTHAFGDRARTFAECTMSIKEGRINKEITEFGTDTRIFLRCPLCGEYVFPQRENFIGYQSAATVVEARETAGYSCQKCTSIWSEEHRLAALKNPVLVSKGQTVDRNGVVQGEAPKTNTFGVRWNKMHSPLTTMADIAETEFRARLMPTDANLKAVYQFTWALPYEGRLLDSSEISVEAVLEHIKYSDYKSGRKTRLPFKYNSNSTCVTGGIDIHKRDMVAIFDAWELDEEGFLLRSWRLGYLIPYTYPNPSDPDAIYKALEHIRAWLMPGWQDSEGKEFNIRAVGIDSGWQATTKMKRRVVSGGDYQVYRFARNYGIKTWRPIKGEPTLDEGIVKVSQLQKAGVFLWHIDTDLAKSEVHDQLRVRPGQNGFWHLPHDTPREYARGLCAEKRIVDFDEKNREKAEWVQEDPYNHPFDAEVYSWAMARALGAKPPRTGLNEEKKETTL